MSEPLEFATCGTFLAVAPKLEALAGRLTDVGISQPSVSQQMRDFGSVFGVPLFSRRWREADFLPTPRGLIFRSTLRRPSAAGKLLQN